MKYVPGLLAGQLSGSAGSTVASHNRNGSYFRTRVVPANPNTTLQSARRMALQAISAAWRTESAATRLGWAALGAQMTRLDSQGVVYTLTGAQAYLSVNLNRFTQGLALTGTYPAISDPGNLLTATLTSTVIGPTLSMAYTATPLAAGVKAFIEATGPLSQGINFVPRSSFKLIAVTAAAAASPANIIAAWQAKFGSPIAGQKIFGRIRLVNADGFVGTPIGAIAVVT